MPTPSTSVSSFASDTSYFPSHRFLHLCHYGNEFMEQCQSNPDFINLFGCEDRFFKSSPHSAHVQSFAFTSSDQQSIDLSSILASNHHLFRFQSAYTLQSGESPLIFDTGASISITPNKEDFISFNSSIDNVILQGISASTVCKGKGMMKLTILNDEGHQKDIVIEALYVPNATVRLLSIQQFCQTYKDGARMEINESGCIFTFPKSQGSGTITFDLKGSGNLPRTNAFRQHQRDLERINPNQSGYSVLNGSNINLTPAQRELLGLHWQLNHINFPWIQYLLRKGIFHRKYKDTTIATVKCKACQLGKQVRLPKGTMRHEIRESKDGSLKSGNLQPGSVISSDQFVSSLKGRLPHTFGKEREEEKYVGGTIFVDDASEFMYVENQVSLGAAETIRSKDNFERECIQHGINIKSYRCDNGVYRSKAFLDDLKSKQQAIQFSGVGAHHHNGVAERAIRTISTSARTILLHAMVHWPEHVTLDLWPFAIQYAIYIWNRLPRQSSGFSPLEIFYNVKSDHSELKQAKVWGCPTYVLHPTLQDGKKLPRWEPRAKIGQFLGRSKQHAGCVALVKNIATGKVSSQFHLVFDDHFTTIPVNKSIDSNELPEEWLKLFVYQRENIVDPTDLPSASTPPIRDNLPPIALPPISPNSTPPEGAVPPSPLLSSPPEGANPTADAPTDSGGSVPLSSEPAPASPVLDQPTSRPSRVRQRPDYYVPGAYISLSCIQHNFFDRAYLSYLTTFNQLNHHDAFLLSDRPDQCSSPMTKQFALLHRMKLDSHDPTILHGQHPLAFAARANDADTPTLKEALESPDREGFIQAMHSEIQQLEDFKVWNVVPRQRAIDMNKTIISSTSLRSPHLQTSLIGVFQLGG